MKLFVKMKTTLKGLGVRLVDILCFPLTFVFGIWLLQIKKGLHIMPLSKTVLEYVGVMPVRHHYYDPIVYERDLRKPLEEDRALPALDMNIPEQLDILNQFHYNEELFALPVEEVEKDSFYYLNHWFGPGDAEYLFNMIRCYKPSNIIEIGSGYSTLIAAHAITKNVEENDLYECRQFCIEPYENKWLEDIDVEVVRKRVEEVDLSYFEALNSNDFLFIDSSHVIRPQGDVLFEYLELLAALRSGVIIQIHDIFTPRDYIPRWVLSESKLFNEQYLLEAFLSYNHQFKVIGALNHLWHNYRNQLANVCPILAGNDHLAPSSFWLKKI